jgi:hypothetical protein
MINKLEDENKLWFGEVDELWVVLLKSFLSGLVYTYI